MNTKDNVSFKDLTTLKVGGVAKTVLYPETKEAVQEVIKKIRESDESLLILGGGSNIVPPEEDFDGVVVIPSLSDISIQNETTTAGSGVVWDKLVEKTASKGLWGFENLSAIPGTVGGAVFQNIGAYGAALSQTVASVNAYDIDTDSFVTFKNKECDFGYRTSVFKKERGRYVILSATFSLSKEPRPNISYKDLAEHFSGVDTPQLYDVRDAVIKIRKDKFPDINKYGTAGSFFLNPVVGEGEADDFKKQYPTMPLFPMPEGGVKIPLAWLLDNILKIKGMKEGGAFVWEKQALVIATDKDATAHDIYVLAEKIKNKVKKEINLDINFEVTFL